MVSSDFLCKSKFDYRDKKESHPFVTFAHRNMQKPCKNCRIRLILFRLGIIIYSV